MSRMPAVLRKAIQLHNLIKNVPRGLLDEAFRTYEMTIGLEDEPTAEQLTTFKAYLAAYDLTWEQFNAYVTLDAMTVA